MLLKTLVSFALLAVLAAAQNAPVAAVLNCPSSQSVRQDDPATFTWSGGVNTPNYRLLLGPTQGSTRDGDSSLISGTKAQLAGLPSAQNLYVTLWSYDKNGNAVEPPSYCAIRTAPESPKIEFKDVPQTSLTGVSVGTFPPVATETGAVGCHAQCELNAACQGYTYYPAGNGNAAASCDLKSQILSTDPNPCCITALKTVLPAEIPAAPVVTAPAPISAAPAPAPAVKSSKSSSKKASKSKEKSAAVITPPAPAPAPVPAPTPEPAPRAPEVAPAPVAAPAAAAASAPKGITGDWVNQAGGISHLTQKGSTISGTYSDPTLPSLTGGIQGTFDGSTLKATLTWKNGGDSSHGTLALTLTPLGRLEGTWTDAAGVSGPWSMGPSASVARPRF